MSEKKYNPRVLLGLELDFRILDRVEILNRVLTLKVPGGQICFLKFPKSLGLEEHVGTKINLCSPKKPGFQLQATVMLIRYSQKHEILQKSVLTDFLP